QRAQASAAASVTRTSSSARFRSGASTTGAPPWDGTRRGYLGPYEPVGEAADALVGEQRLDPAGGDRRRAVAGAGERAGDGAVRVGVAAEVAREHDRRLDVWPAERRRKADPERRQDEAHPLLGLGREHLLGRADRLPG